MRLALLAFLVFGAAALAGCESDESDFIPCRELEDCATGYLCVTYPDANVGVCTEDCNEGCAPGYECSGDGTRQCVASGS